MENHQESILDKIISSKQSQDVADLNPADIIVNLLKILNAKERDVVARRFGLLGRPKETLEEIGQSYNVTRERVRQIERGGIKKLKNLDSAHKSNSHVEKVEDLVIRFLEEHGGVMSEKHLLENILFNGGDNELNRQSLLFIMDELTSNRLNLISDDQHFNRSWRLDSLSADYLKELLAEIILLLETENIPLKEEDLMGKLLTHEPFQAKKKQLVMPLGYSLSEAERDRKLITAYLNLSKRMKKNIFDEWGLTSWSTVSPKKINDKIYLILKQENKPLHFGQISDFINRAKFDAKTAYPATVHNELILDPKYILVGRGIYALKEWGYEPGPVAEVIMALIRKNGPMTKKEIVEMVLEQRMVSPNTINLALTNKKKFKKTENGKYTIAE